MLAPKYFVWFQGEQRLKFFNLVKKLKLTKRLKSQVRHQVEVAHHATSTWVDWPASSDSGKSAELEAEKVASGKP